MALNILPLNKQLVKRYWNFKEYEVESIKCLRKGSRIGIRSSVQKSIVKFTDYLRGYYQTVNSEVESLNGMLNKSTTEVRGYPAELMVAAQDGEGSTRRIEELERRKNLAENVAQQIYDKGMIMREEYQDQVQNLLVMGREILARILNHFKTPGVRNTLFTMEHIVEMQYFGDSQFDQF